MFAYIDKIDKKLNITHRNYFLTQGDSFTLTANVNDDAKTFISKFVFKIGKKVGECKIEQFYEQDYVLVDGEWLCIVRGETTSQWLPTSCPENADEPYIYEIEVIYVDGEPETLEQSEFTIEPQNKKVEG